METDFLKFFGEEYGITEDKIKILYEENGHFLAEADGFPYLWDGEFLYKISSYPYEPCTYIIRKDSIVTTIHNAFDYGEILSLAKRGGAVVSATGNEYGIKRIFDTLLSAVPFYDTDISYLEGAMAVKKLKDLGATSPETAVFCSTLGVKKISDRFSHSRKLAERVMHTEDGRVYVRINK